MKISENWPEPKAKPEKRRCDGEVFNRYENGGMGGMVPCGRPAEPGHTTCRYHREEKPHAG